MFTSLGRDFCIFRPSAQDHWFARHDSNEFGPALAYHKSLCILRICFVYPSYMLRRGYNKSRFFVNLVEKYYTKFTCNVLFGNIIY